MSKLDTTYIEGFMAKCAELGVDPESVLKSAQGCDMSTGETMKDQKGLKPGKKIKVEKLKVDEIKEAMAKVAKARK